MKLVLLVQSLLLVVSSMAWSAEPTVKIGGPLSAELDLGALVRRASIELDPATDDRHDEPLPIARSELDALVARYIEKRDARRGDGGGHDITPLSLVLIQTNFRVSSCPVTNCAGDCVPVGDGCGGEACNVLLLLWSESTENPEGVDVYVDNEPVTTVPGVQPNSSVNLLFLGGLNAGEHTVRVEEINTGTFDELPIEVLDVQPFGDVSLVECAQGPVGTNGCSVLLRFSQSGPLPNRQSILLTNESGTSVLGDFFVSPDDPFFLQTVLELGGFQPIDWMFTLIGFLQADDGTSRVEYRGCFERSPVCSLDCALDLCEAPVFPWVGQLTYGETVNDNNLLMFWVCPDMDPSGVCLSWSTVRVLADDFDLGTTEQSTIFLQSIPGDFLLGLQGVCGGDGDSTVRSMGVSVLTETPIANPFVDGIVTREDLGDGSARLRWTYGERTDFGLAWIGNTIVAAFPTGLPGEFGEIVVPGVQPNDVLFVQVFRYEGAQAFGSERIEAGASTQAGYFIRGLCAAATGSPDPQINDAIFLLGSLFLATGAPPCPIACDVNATGVLELTDAVVILQYLFLSGPAPAGWIDRMPTCEPLLPGVPGFELGCGTPHEICTEPGPVGG